jgi:hypothetical protein
MNCRMFAIPAVVGLWMMSACATPAVVEAEHAQEVEPVAIEESTEEAEIAEVDVEIEEVDEASSTEDPEHVEDVLDDEDSQAIEISAELFIDGRVVSRPTIVTLSEQPVQITGDYNGELVLVVDLEARLTDSGRVHLTGSVQSRNRVVHRIDNDLAFGDILNLTLVIDTRVHEVNLTTRLWERT